MSFFEKNFYALLKSVILIIIPYFIIPVNDIFSASVDQLQNLAPKYNSLKYFESLFNHDSDINIVQILKELDPSDPVQNEIGLKLLYIYKNNNYRDKVIVPDEIEKKFITHGHAAAKDGPFYLLLQELKAAGNNNRFFIKSLKVILEQIIIFLLMNI